MERATAATTGVLKPYPVSFAVVTAQNSIQAATHCPTAPALTTTAPLANTDHHPYPIANAQPPVPTAASQAPSMHQQNPRNVNAAVITGVNALPPPQNPPNPADHVAGDHVNHLNVENVDTDHDAYAPASKVAQPINTAPQNHEEALPQHNNRAQMQVAPIIAYQTAHDNYDHALRTIWNDFVDGKINKTEMDALNIKADYKFREESHQVRVDLSHTTVSDQTITTALYHQFNYIPVQIYLRSKNLLTVYPRNGEDAQKLAQTGIVIPPREKLAGIILPAVQALQPRTTLLVETYLPQYPVKKFFDSFYSDQDVHVEVINPLTTKTWVHPHGSQRAISTLVISGYKVIMSDLVTLSADHVIISGHQCFVRNAAACIHCRSTWHSTDNCLDIQQTIAQKITNGSIQGEDTTAGPDGFKTVNRRKAARARLLTKPPPMHDIRPSAILKAAELTGQSLTAAKLDKIRMMERRKKEELQRQVKEANHRLQEAEDNHLLQEAIDTNQAAIAAIANDVPMDTINDLTIANTQWEDLDQAVPNVPEQQIPAVQWQPQDLEEGEVIVPSTQSDKNNGISASIDDENLSTAEMSVASYSMTVSNNTLPIDSQLTQVSGQSVSDTSQIPFLETQEEEPRIATHHAGVHHMVTTIETRHQQAQRLLREVTDSSSQPKRMGTTKPTKSRAQKRVSNHDC